jgi:hypothetical protein
METKKCNVCNEFKSLDNFYKYSKGKYYEYQCKQCKNNKNKKYYIENKEAHNKRTIKWSNNNKEKHISLNKKTYNKNREDKNWIEKKLKYSISYIKNRIKQDPQFKLQHCLRNRFHHALKKETKSNSITFLLGCSISEFKSYTENQFQPEMNWGNHGVIWEIDHIKPCSSFDLSLEEEQQKCFHYTNLQPLFKTSKIAESFGYIGYVGNRNKLNKYL